MQVVRQIKGKTAEDRRTIFRGAVRAPIESLKNMDRWTNPEIDTDCLVLIKGVGEFQVRARCDDLYHVLPAREPAILRTIRETLRAGDTFIDAGANIGFYTVLASRLVGPSGRVIAVEMMPDTASRLREQVARNACTNVTVVEKALSDQSGKTVIAYVEPGMFGQASISKQQLGRVVEVETITLADIISNIPVVSLIKMDLEGAELQALKDFGDICGCVNKIIFEDWGDNAVVNFLREIKYKVKRLDGNNSVATSCRVSTEKC